MAGEEELLANGFAAGGFMAMIFAFLAVFLVIFVIVYIYSAIALMAIAKRTKTKNGWLAFIPIANVYLLTQIAGLSGWWTLIVLAPIVPVVGNIAVAAATVWMFWLTAEKVGMPGWTSILMLVPLVNLVVLGLYAWKK